MLKRLEDINKDLLNGKKFFIAGDENLLKQINKGSWIGGTIPYFMDTDGGIVSKERLFADELPDFVTDIKLVWYNEKTLENIPKDAPENGFSVIIIPATSTVHVSYAYNAPNFTDMFLKPVIGWISGVHLSDLGKISPKVINGETGKFSTEEAIVMHCSLPKNKIATIGIVNLFKQGNGDTLTFDTEGFSVKDCFVNGKKMNFADYLTSKKIDTRLPLVANYCGAMVNVSFQSVDEKGKTVDLYAPVFKNVAYKIAEPINNYVTEFASSMPSNLKKPAFSCNCILNFLYSELEGKKTGGIIGPITFGEVAYQLLNQTLVYLDIQDN